MATEGFLLHDGTQTIAAANYGNNQSLAGPGGSGQFLGAVLSQSADRTSVLASVAGQQIYGVIQNKPATGDAVDVALFGVTKAVAAAAGVTRGKPQMVTATGAFTDWTAGSGYAQVGYALESATNGQIFSMVIGVAMPKVLT
jgi:hypothetical protein